MAANETEYSLAKEVSLDRLEEETPPGNAAYGTGVNLAGSRRHPITPIQRLGRALGNLGQLPARGRNRPPSPIYHHSTPAASTNLSPISHHSTPAASPNASPISYHSTPVASPNASAAENSLHNNNNSNSNNNNSNNNNSSLLLPPPLKRQKTKRSRKYRKASRKNRRN